MRKRIRHAAVSLLFGIGCAAPAAAVDVDAFIRKPDFNDVKISPTGEYLAATVPLENTTALAVVRVSDGAITGGGTAGKYRHVSDIWWANDERLLFSTSMKMGMLDQPLPTGDIFTLRATSRSADVLVGQHVTTQGVGSRIGGKRIEEVWARVVDTLRDHDHDAIIAVAGFGDDPYARAERMNVVTGRRTPITRAPVRNGEYATAHAGAVRAAIGYNVDRSVKTYVRASDGAQWELFNDEASSGVSLVPLGFSADNRVMYLRADRPTGTSRIEAHDTVTGERTVVLADEGAEPLLVIHDPVTSVPAGVMYMDGKARTEFFDPASPLARQYRSLEAAFPG